MTKFLEEEIKNFEILEEDEGETKAQNANSRVRCWVGTWNNPKMTDEEFKQHFENLHSQELLQYAIFQREKGEESGIIHFQFFLNFKNPQYFKKVKEKYIPYGCHFKPMISTAHRCREYCSKVETRVSGPYEIGEFEEEGQRSDLKKAIKMIDEGVPYSVVAKIYPSQSLMYGRQLKLREQMRLEEESEDLCRNVSVEYVYGPPGVGKTSYVNSQVNFKFSDLFVVENYGEYLFTGYKRQKVVLFDEFYGQVKPIAKMNKLLEPYPKRLRVIGDMVPAFYEKVYIVSNYALNELYKDLRPEQEESFKAFCRRINKIVRFDKNGKQFIERDSIWEDIPIEEQKMPGLTRRVSKTIEYDKNGLSRVIYDRHAFEQIKLEELPILDTGELPW